MPKIYLGLEKPMVCWHVAIQDNAAKARPGFKEAKKAMLNGWELGSEKDAGLVADLMTLWAEVTENEVTVKSGWNTVKLKALNYGDVTTIGAVLSDREKDQWLLDRYHDSTDLLDFDDLGRPGMLLMAMLEFAKRRAGFDEAVGVLCQRVSSLMLKRPGCVLDEYLWRVEAGIAKPS